MKVIHIDSEKYFGGGQNQIYLLNKYLIQEGIKSVVFCPLNSPLFLKLRKENYNVQSLSFKNILNYIKKEKPEIIHTHSGKSLTISHVLKVLSPGIKVLFTRRITRGIKFCFFRKFLIDAVVCISEDIKKRLEECFPAHKVFIIYSGIEKEKVNVPEPTWHDKNKFIIGNIGHLLPYKDHITLIRGFYEFLKVYPDSLLVIIGEGGEKENILHIIRKLKIEDRVILTGFLPDAGSYIKYFSVFVITSSHTEGLCSSIIDAFMQKVPVIATNTGGIKELVKNNVTGILISKRNTEELKNALLKIKEDKKLVNELIRNAYEYSFNFTAENMVQCNLEVYKKLLSY